VTFEEQFKEAGIDGKEFRGAPFWSWNDDLDPEELRRQVRSMCESGMGGFFMHARAGLITPYMSEEYFECHHACIEEARKLGMDAWLYDEDCWPSGSGGNVTESKGPFYQAKKLIMEKISGGQIEPTDNTIAVFRCASENDTITDYRRVSISELETSEVDLLHCYWQPDGYIDVMSEEAVAQFIDNTHDAFAKVFKHDFGGVIPGIFTDEPNYNHHAFSPTVPWTLDFIEEFKRRTGYDITDNLPQVFFDCGDYRKIRHDFWRVITELYVQAFSKQIYDWCELHKLKLTGHYLLEDDLHVQIQHIGAAMPHYEYEQVPGIDHLCRRIADPILPKQVSSVAHQFGGRRVLSEMFGCSGWNMSFEDQKWIAEWQYVLGVNLMCQHLCLYSLKGWRKRDYPPSIYYQQPWWPRYKQVEDHFARLASALTMGKHVADVLLIHPIESAWAEYNPFHRTEAVDSLNADFSSVSRFLQEFHIDYDYGDESILERHATVVDGQVKVGDVSYNLVVLPRTTTLRRSTVDLLSRWIEQGGNVIVCGSIPTMIDGVETPEPGVILGDQPVVPVDFLSLRDAVLDMLNTRVQVLDEYGSDARSIYYQQRDLGAKQLFYFVNIDNTDLSYNAIIRFAGRGSVEEWDLDTGEITELEVKEIRGATVVERKFAPTQSRLLSFDPTIEPRIAALEQWIAVDESDITGPWKFTRTEPNAITLDYCRYKIAGGDFSESTPTIWLGTKLADIEKETPVTLRYSFTTDFSETKSRGFTLAMECPERFDIFVNGTKIAYADQGWWCDISFKKIDIEPYIKPGENVIEMTCNYLGEKGRRKRQEELDVRDLWSRMWTNPPADVKNPIIIPYSGKIADTIREYNYLKMGLDLESIYILGDFAVKRTEDGGFILRDDNPPTQIGDLVLEGYPFYRGTVVYEGTFNHKGEDEDKLLLRVSDMGGIIANVTINGIDAGTLKWRPMELDISPCVRPGSNDIRIEITNSNRNLLGPHHHVAGELFAVGPGSFGANMQDWTDDYNFVQTGLLLPPKLVYMRKS